MSKIVKPPQWEDEVSPKMTRTNRVTFDICQLEKAGFTNLRFDLTDGRFNIEYTAPCGEVFDAKYLQSVTDIIGEEEAETLLMRAERALERGTIIALLSK